MSQGRLETLAILIQIALRNLFASRLKTLIVGGIIFLGSFLVVVGTSLLDSINQGMATSITGSIGGHLQVYNGASKDELALYGSMTGDTDIKPFEDYSRIKQSLLKVPGIKAMVPMGIAEAQVGSGNYFDHALERLRALAKRSQAGERSPEFEAEYAAAKDHVQQMIRLLEKDALAAQVLMDENAIDRQAVADRERAASTAFWSDFDRAPYDALEFLENQIAPQTMDGDMLWARYIGTDLEAYKEGFDRLEVIEGQEIPKGQRGMLLGKLYYDDWIKMKTARRLDKMREWIQQGGRTIAKDEELQRSVKENQSQVRDVLVQLDSLKTRELVGRLQKALGTTEADPDKLLKALLATTDENFEARYQLFYSEVAPLVNLYKVRVGDTITIKAFTRAGYMKSVNVKIYGICQFKGLEKSSFASMMSVMDLMTFRDLYGFLTPDRLAEIRKLKQAAGAKEVARENAEAELFGSAEAPTVAEARPVGFDELAELQAAERVDLSSKVYTREELERGVALNVALVLEDPSRIQEMLPRVQAQLAADGLNTRVVDWQKAAGMIGQFITTMRWVLFSAVFILFVIALVIINNAMVMATLQRVKEIGTLRAIGAQRRFVLSMVAVETVAVGLLFGALGGAAGAGLIGWLHRVGIPANNDYAYFFFAGPRLRPHLDPLNLGIAFGIVLLVSIFASLYPALVATRITPIQAMMSEE